MQPQGPEPEAHETQEEPALAVLEGGLGDKRVEGQPGEHLAHQAEESELPVESEGASGDTSGHPERKEQGERREQAVQQAAEDKPVYPGALDPEYERKDADDARRLWPRLTSAAVTLVIVLAMLYIGKDLVPARALESAAMLIGWDYRLPAQPVELERASSPDVTPAFVTTPGAPIDEAAFGENVSPGLDEVALDAMAPETSKPGAVGQAAEGSVGRAPEREFSIRFLAGSKLLEAEGWHALDTVALMLRDRAGVFVVVMNEAGGIESDEALDESRMTVVEQYLVAAGVDRNRIQIGNAESSFGELGEERVAGGDGYISISIKGD